MKFNSRLKNAVTTLREIASSQGNCESINPAIFVQQIRVWFQNFILPLYPKSPKEFLGIQFLLETSDSEIPSTTASCLKFIQSVERFSYRDRNQFIQSIADFINDLVIHRHPLWLDPLQGDYEYYYCSTTSEVILCGEFGSELTLSGETWERNTVLLPAKRSVLVEAGVLPVI
jgi:hypothetical protein